jgi:hypothetical protein
LFINLPGTLGNEIYLLEYNSHAAFHHEENQEVIFTGRNLGGRGISKLNSTREIRLIRMGKLRILQGNLRRGVQG